MSTVTPGQVAAAGSIGFNYGPDSMFPPIYLTGATLTANAAAFPTLTFPAYATLAIAVSILGYSASDLGSLRFNGDTGANYWDRNFTSVAGGIALVNTETTTTTQMRFGIATAKQVVGFFNICNNLGVSKLVNGRVSIASGAVGTAGIAVLSMSGEWVNTTAQITSLNVQVVGANNFLSGSSIQVFGGL
jgi:hypothetical protein